MPAILSSLPYSDLRLTVVVRGREEAVKPTQIIIWVSITESGQAEFDLERVLNCKPVFAGTRGCGRGL